MARIELSELSAEIPENWNVQGMLTLTLPSPDKNVKPNVIITKEYLPQEADLGQYFDKIKESIQNRGIRDLKISDEKDVVISGVRGKMMVCSWDVSAMAELMKKELGDPQGAVGYYERALQVDPQHLENWKKVAELQRLLDNPTKQREALLQVVELTEGQEQVQTMRKVARLSQDAQVESELARSAWETLL